MGMPWTPPKILNCIHSPYENMKQRLCRHTNLIRLAKFMETIDNVG